MLVGSGKKLSLRENEAGRSDSGSKSIGKREAGVGGRLGEGR